MLNPINHTRTAGGRRALPRRAVRRGADVYAHPMHIGRGGWTWYTGSAGWMYQAAIEGCSGCERHGATFSVTPYIPAMWPRVLDRLEGRRQPRYRISVVNPEHRSRGVRSAEFDGVADDPDAIPLVDDGKTHEVVVQLGDPPATPGRDAGSDSGNHQPMTFGIR